MRLLSFSALALLTVVMPSCNVFHPRQGVDTYAAQPPASPGPYGAVPQSNPYATAPANTYGQPAANPYAQPPAAPSNPYAQAPSNPYSGGGYEQPQTAPSNSGSGFASPAAGGGGSGGQVVVQSGDTLSRIAQRNHTTVTALKSANGLTSDLIRIGQKLNLP